ncbi:MAG: histidine phosphatase family protein [Clostridiales bacterium]|nr:histidine phosphatase family protein [Clostridiales bacterium]
MRLYIIRHGDPDYEKDSLTELGKKEAEALADYLPRLGLTHLYTSPLGRARETSMPSAKKLGLPVSVLPWARELTGVYYDIEGFGRAAPFTLPGEVSYALQPVPRYEGWKDQKYFDDPRFAALIREMEEGSDALLKDHGYERQGALYRVNRPSDDRVAVFCHQGLGTSWLAHLLNFPYQAAWAGLWQACSSITTVSMERRSGQYAIPRMIGMSETPHIDLAELEINERGLAQNIVG